MRNLPTICLLLCSSLFAQVKIVNEQTGTVHNSFAWGNEATLGVQAQLCNGGPPFYCGRTDTNRLATPPPPSLLGLTGAGACLIDTELGATICRATDAATNTNNGFRTVSDSNSNSVSLDGRLFSFVDQGGRGYLEEIDPYTQPWPTLHYRGFVSQAWAGEALSFSHTNPNVFYGQGFKASGFTGYVGSPAISQTTINRSDPAWLSAGANTDLSTTTAVTINQAFLDPSASNCLGGAAGFYYPFLNTSDIYGADPNDRFFSQALRGSQDEAFLMVYYDTTIPGCHWWNTRTMTEGGTWGNVGPIANQQWYLLPIPSAPTVVQTTSGSLITGHQYAVCISLTQNNVGETPCSPNSTITMSGTNHGITVTAPNINPANVLVAATGYNTYACDLTVNPSCTPTLQYNGGATNPLTPPSGFSIACTAQCTGANQYNYEVWLWAITLPTTTVAGGMSAPTAPVIINQTAGNNPTWTITYTPPVGATDIAIQRACTSGSLVYCSTPNNFIFDQVKQVKVCATPPCTVTAALAGGGGDNTRTYEMVTVSNNGSSLPNASITNISTTTVQPANVNTAGIKIHDNRLNPAGTWSMVSVVQSGNYGPLINNTNNPLLHDIATGVIVAATTTHSDPAHNVAALATGHKVLSYTQGCAQDTLINGIMTDCWPLVDSSTGMEAGLRHLNPYFIGTPQDNGAHHLSVQGQAPYPGVIAANYPVVQGVTNFESTSLPTDALVGTVYAAATIKPGYYAISGPLLGQVNNQNPQHRLCTNWNSATAGDGAGAFNSETSGNFSPNGLMGIITSDMGSGSATGLPRLGDINGNDPPLASGTKSAATMSRTDIFVCFYH